MVDKQDYQIMYERHFTHIQQYQFNSQHTTTHYYTYNYIDIYLTAYE